MNRQEVQDLKDTIQKLKARLNNLYKENKKLKSDISTLQRGFDETSKFVKGQLADYSLEEVFAALKERRKLKKQVKKIEQAQGCPKCGGKNVKESKLPHGSRMKSCKDCTYIEVIKDESEN